MSDEQCDVRCTAQDVMPTTNRMIVIVGTRARRASRISQAEYTRSSVEVLNASAASGDGDDDLPNLNNIGG